MARYRSKDQQEWFHFPAAHSIIITRRLRRALWLWIKGLRCLALSPSRGRRSCAFGRGRRSDNREKCTNSLLCKQTPAPEPGPHRACENRQEACPVHLLRRSDRSRRSGGREFMLQGLMNWEGLGSTLKFSCELPVWPWEKWSLLWTSGCFLY